MYVTNESFGISKAIYLFIEHVKINWDIIFVYFFLNSNKLVHVMKHMEIKVLNDDNQLTQVKWEILKWISETSVSKDMCKRGYLQMYSTQIRLLFSSIPAGHMMRSKVLAQNCVGSLLSPEKLCLESEKTSRSGSWNMKLPFIFSFSLHFPQETLKAFLKQLTNAEKSVSLMRQFICYKWLYFSKRKQC